MTIHYAIDAGVATFTIDSGKHNFMTVSMYEAMTGHIAAFDADDSVSVGILTGSAGNSFCAGDDLTARPRPIDVTPHWPTKMFTAPRRKPIVSAIDGWALGGGFQMAIGLSDIRVATTEAKLGAPEIAYGMGGIGGALRITRHLPRTVAMQLLLTGDYLTAPQAKRLNLVNRVVATSDLFGAADEIARRIARHPLIAITTELQAIDECTDLDNAEALKHAGTLYRAQLKQHEATAAYDELTPTKPDPIDLGDGPGL